MKLHTLFLKRFCSLGIVVFLVAASLSGCQDLYSSHSSERHSSNNGVAINDAFEEFTTNLFLEELTSNTLNLHYSLEDPATLGITEYEISLGDFSAEARESSSTYLKETLSEVLAYDYELLSLENQLTYDILVDYLNTQIDLCKYDFFEEPLGFSGGLQMELPILFAEYEFNNERDIQDYLEMVSLTDEYFDQIMMFEAEKSNNNMFMSADLCDLLIDSCENFLLDRENHYLISSFDSRLKELDLSEQKQASYSRQNKAILEKQVFPAYERMIDTLTQLRNTGTNNLGICYFEQGADYYQHLVYAATGCEDSVDVIFERIENKRMEDLLVCSKLQAEDENLIAKCNTLDWKMDNPSDMLASLQSAILEEFPAPIDCSYEINYVEPALEDFLAPAFYIVAPFDNYTENVIYINNSYISSDIYAFTTLAHEGYPGHLYQTVMSYNYDLPMIRSMLDYSGFVEGWATYIEMMSYEYAGLDENVAMFLSHNQAATLSLYASSDIGLHYYGWTDSEMKEFWAGYGITNDSVINEITQLILSEPGNYLKYYVGYLEFLELKEYAKNLFGSQYSDKQFHQALLDIGPAPFSILEKYLPLYYSSPQT